MLVPNPYTPLFVTIPGKENNPIYTWRFFFHRDGDIYLANLSRPQLRTTQIQQQGGFP